jgi:hypothetical protein
LVGIVGSRRKRRGARSCRPRAPGETSSKAES